jgi:hypothetical protein
MKESPKNHFIETKGGRGGGGRERERERMPFGWICIYPEKSIFTECKF